MTLQEQRHYLPRHLLLFSLLLAVPSGRHLRSPSGSIPLSPVKSRLTLEVVSIRAEKDAIAELAAASAAAKIERSAAVAAEAAASAIATAASARDLAERKNLQLEQSLASVTSQRDTAQAQLASLRSERDAAVSEVRRGPWTQCG
jgi:hypothetical protein